MLPLGKGILYSMIPRPGSIQTCFTNRLRNGLALPIPPNRRNSVSSLAYATTASGFSKIVDRSSMVEFAEALACSNCCCMFSRSSIRSEYVSSDILRFRKRELSYSAFGRLRLTVSQFPSGCSLWTSPNSFRIWVIRLRMFSSVRMSCRMASSTNGSIRLTFNSGVSHVSTPCCIRESQVR